MLIERPATAACLRLLATIVVTGLTSLTAAAAGYSAKLLKFPQDMGNGCGVRSMNDKAQLSGGCFTPDGMFSVGFATKAGGKRAADFGLLGGSDSYAWSINAAGVQVGEATLPGDVTYRAVLKRPGDTALTDLGDLGGSDGFSIATDINDKGQIIGISSVPSGQTHIFLTKLNDLSLKDLGSAGGDFVQPQRISNKGVIVGSSSFVPGSYTWHAIYAKPPGYKFVDLGTLGGLRSIATDINDNGVIVGASQFDAGKAYRAFIADIHGGAMRDLGTPAGQPSYALAINNLNQVVGYYFRADTNSYNAFVCTNDCSQLGDLTSLTTGLPDGVQLTTADTINNIGVIVARGSDNRVYMLTPQ